MHENELASLAVDIMYHIHVDYGPGLFESVYEEIFCYEWNKKTGIPYTRQQIVPLTHDNLYLGMAFRADIILDNKLLLEFKSVSELASVHFKQVVTYLKLSKLKLGLLVNFNTALIKDGIHRVVNGL